ncbi:FHA domain-containing protein [Streptomyces sp. TRM70350]|uniref:FHA domain-containing protein n=1 Tax=Streptomyces sp. TRM70350 TaxID=2856165 RepID=UPI0021103CC1|nr:FHA domain-containing protein [Streptomyces sp. TRM70350]
MQIRLTVVDPLGPPHEARGRAASRDVLVTAPAGTALSAVASALAAAVSGDAQSGPVVLYAGAERLDPQRCSLGEPPLLDGAVLSVGGPAAPEPHPELEDAPARLDVIAGPDAGGVHLLHGGEIRVGRSTEVDVPLDDPDVSRVHCAVTLSADGRVSVADLNSTNGTTLDGTRVGTRPTRFTPGALLRIGESTLRLAPAGGPGRRVGTAPDGEGCVRVGVSDGESAPAAASGARAGGLSGKTGHAYGGAEGLGVPEGGSAAVENAGPDVSREGPEPTGAAPADSARTDHDEHTHAAQTGTAAKEHARVEPHLVPEQGRPPRIESRDDPHTGPRPAGPPSDATHSGRVGAGTADAPAATPSRRKGTPLRGTDVPQGVRRRGGLTAWARRLAGGRGGEQEAAGHVGYGEDSAGGAAVHPVRADAPETWPDPAALLLTALSPGPRLWERGPGHPEALTVRLGTADRAAPDGSGLLPAVPVTADLREAGALGLAGPRPRLAGLARAVVAQLAALHSPDALEIVLISTDRARSLEERSAEWAWLGWLPHLRPAHGQDCRLLLAHDREQAAARTDELLRRLDDHLAERNSSARKATAPAPATPDQRHPGNTATPTHTATTPARRHDDHLTDHNSPTAKATTPAPATPDQRHPGNTATPTHTATTPARRHDDHLTHHNSPTAKATTPAPATPDQRHPGNTATPTHTATTPPRRHDDHLTEHNSPTTKATTPAPATPDQRHPGNTEAKATAPAPAAADQRHPRSAEVPTRASTAPPRRPSWARPDDDSPIDAAHPDAHPGPYAVLVVDGDPGGAGLREAVARLALEGPQAGIHVICLAETAPASPASPVTETYEAACTAAPAFRACGAVALLSGDVATALRLLRVARVGTGTSTGTGTGSPAPVGHGTVGTVDAVSPAWAERFARALAPLRTDATATGTRHARVSAPLPQAARLLDELGLARATPASLMARWADAADDTHALGGRAHAVLGAGPRGPVAVDLVTEGPHLLIEGPPGSGRTELLRAVVASLAAAERPDRLSLVLMDGRDSVGAGSGHADGLHLCMDIPHVTTHLLANDPVRMREFAQSLSAELKRRAELLGRSEFAEWHTGREVSGRMVSQRSASPTTGAGDLDTPPSATLRLRPAAGRRPTDDIPPLPRLVVVVDDLDALVSPPLGSPGRPAAGSVIRALEAVARDGERLGVHLVAAAGPGGRTAETEPARRATLRVTLDAPAPGPDEPAPGRGRLAHPDGRVTPFQGGRVTGRIPRTATLRPTVVPLEWHRMGDPPARRPVRELGNGPTDLALLASALERAAREVAASELPSLL